LNGLDIAMRFHKASATKGVWDDVSMQRAVEDVITKKLSERKATEVYGVKRSTLKRRRREARQLPESAGFSLMRSSAYHNSAMKIFSVAEEKELADYCMRA